MKKQNLFKALVVLILFVGFVSSNCKRDKEDPIIILLGDNPMKLVLNKPYVEPGYTAEDDKDGDITSKVNVSDTIIPDTVGMYVIEYSVKDNKDKKDVVEREVERYNEAAKYEGVFLGNFVYPYPGTEPQSYIDSIKFSETVNNQLVFRNFANNLGINITAIVEPVSADGPILLFEEQTTSVGTFSFDFVKDSISTISMNRIIVYYKLTADGETNAGLLVLNRY